MDRYTAVNKSSMNTAYRYECNSNIYRTKMYFDGARMFKYRGDALIVINPDKYEGLTDWEPCER